VNIPDRKRKLTSIIMPTFDAGNSLIHAINSVLLQSHTDWELLIVDDGSTDHSIKLAKQKFTDPRIRFLTNKFEKGAAGARKTARKNSKGVYIAYLDSDDVWLPNHLSTAVKCLKEKSAVFSNYSAVHEQGKNIDYQLPESVSLRSLKASNFLPCLTVVHRAELLKSEDYPIIKKRNDLAIWIRILKRNRGIRFYNTGENTAKYSVSATGLSGNYFDSVRFCFINIKREFGTPQAYISTVSHMIIAITKKRFPLFYSSIVRKVFSKI
jgi:teichuronic acid biosynthesis glycosyltransferase TuaG